jgi:hypothetical protein
MSQTASYHFTKIIEFNSMPPFQLDPLFMLFCEDSLICESF